MGAPENLVSFVAEKSAPVGGYPRIPHGFSAPFSAQLSGDGAMSLRRIRETKFQCVSSDGDVQYTRVLINTIPLDVDDHEEYTRLLEERCTTLNIRAEQVTA